MKTIIFRADSSPEIGMGHVYRLISLIKYLHLEYRCLFFTNDLTILPYEDLERLHVEIHEIGKENTYTIPDKKKRKVKLILTSLIS